MKIEIPKDEQLYALSHGLTAVYDLIQRYQGKPIETDFRKFIDITKNDLINYLQDHPQYAKKHIFDKSELPKIHDLPVLIEENNHWIVCWMDHGQRTDEEIYGSLVEAAANYLMAYW